MAESDDARRWPAYAMAVLMLGYAVGKATFAVQARLGFPGGPPVSAAEAANYFLDPALAQWLASLSGVLGACIAVASISSRARAVPRPLMVAVLAVMTLAVVGGGGVMALDGFVGLGVGWRWYHGVVGLFAIAVALEMFRSYLTASARVRR
ncbi:hypothetical protein [Kribbella sp. CA-247076]|uniref:hypothetical protein n=1 Tax=Kribbella sp. CA-247076 TaxID=3239941 RepID=UPI003D8C4356